MEGPIDIFCLNIAEKLAPFFYKLGHTPNMVTTYSLLSALASLYLLYNGNVFGFVGFSSASYIFDCVDGYMARKYNMITEFGDMYDHFTDFIGFFGTLVVAFFRYGWEKIKPILLILFILGVLMLTYLGCAQQYHNSGSMKETLDFWRILAFSKETHKWARYFSCGTFKLATILAIVYLEYNKK